ncbi:MAG: hypothetical protein WDZ49_11365 [Litorilinea sp.]
MQRKATIPTDMHTDIKTEGAPLNEMTCIETCAASLEADAGRPLLNPVTSS